MWADFAQWYNVHIALCTEQTYDSETLPVRRIWINLFYVFTILWALMDISHIHKKW